MTKQEFATLVVAMQAMYGEDSPRIAESIRISFGRFNTEEEIQEFASDLVKMCKRLAK